MPWLATALLSRLLAPRVRRAFGYFRIIVWISGAEEVLRDRFDFSVQVMSPAPSMMSTTPVHRTVETSS